MNREEMKVQFEKNVEYLKRNVKPDDIYEFAEETFMAALFFIYKWSDWVDVNEEGNKDPVVRKWISNIIGLLRARDKNIDIDLNLDLESLE